jgi:subfamily B ATP-binding cassette protein MsbA
VSGIRLVKSFGAEAYEERRFRTESDRLARGLTRVARVGFLAQPLTETVGTAIAVAILWIGARQVLVGGTLTGAHLLTFLILVMRMLQPLKQLSQVPTTAQQSLAAAERVFHILDAPTESRARPRHARARRSSSAPWPSSTWTSPTRPARRAPARARPVLRDVSLTARRGEIVALVGRAGRGRARSST